MDRVTRKELKSDKFALEVQHSVQFVTGHVLHGQNRKATNHGLDPDKTRHQREKERVSVIGVVHTNR